MNWTTETPTMEGYYWLQGLSLLPELVSIRWFGKQFYVFDSFGNHEPLSKPWFSDSSPDGALWYGPIKAPKWNDTRPGSKRRIAQIDMDGTLVAYPETMLTALNDLAAPDEDVIHDMEAAGHGRGPAHVKARERMIKNQQNFWFNLPPIELGMKVLSEIEAAGFETHVLTKGPPLAPNAWTEKFLWCRKYIPHAKVTITEDKSTSYGRVLFDDWPPYVEAWLEHRPRGLVIMLDYDYNREFDHPQVYKVSQTNPDFDELRAKLKEAYER